MTRTIEIIGRLATDPPEKPLGAFNAATFIGAQAADTYVFKGEFRALTLKKTDWPDGVTFDLQAATINGWQLIGLRGGFKVWDGEFQPAPGRVGLAILDSVDFTVLDGHYATTGLQLRRCERAIVDHLWADNAGLIYAEDCTTLGVRNCIVRGAPANGMSFAGCWDTIVELNSVIGGRRVGDVHPDCIQAWKSLTRPIKDLIIRKNLLVGQGQGIYLKEGKGSSHVEITDNLMILGGFRWGAGVQSADDVTIADNEIRSLPGDTPGGYGIDVRNATNVKISGNTYNGAPILERNISR